MSRPYLQHGRRHAPGGSDPIPGLVASFADSWIFGYDPTGPSITSTSASATLYDLTAAASYTNKGTADFEILAGSGLQIKNAGFYIVSVQVIWVPSGTAAAGSAAQVIWNIGSALGVEDDAPYMPSWPGVANTSAYSAFALDLGSVPDTAPLALTQNAGVSAHAKLQFAVVRLTDDYGDF